MSTPGVDLRPWSEREQGDRGRERMYRALARDPEALSAVRAAAGFDRSVARSHRRRKRGAIARTLRGLLPRLNWG